MTKKAPVLAKRLREIRESLEMSQQAVATKAGLSISIVVQLERGKTGRGVAANPRLETLEKLAAALGVGVEKLIVEE